MQRKLLGYLSLMIGLLFVANFAQAQTQYNTSITMSCSAGASVAVTFQLLPLASAEVNCNGVTWASCGSKKQFKQTCVTDFLPATATITDAGNMSTMLDITNQCTPGATVSLPGSVTCGGATISFGKPVLKH